MPAAEHFHTLWRCTAGLRKFLDRSTEAAVRQPGGFGELAFPA
jgi:hypothetical protein